jgi:DNA adenine methylase
MADLPSMRVPHPIPYQGSKRNLADVILEYFPEGVGTLIEPFAGSAAITLAAAANKAASHFFVSDLNRPLMDLWREIVFSPDQLATQYEAIWNAQHRDRRAYYDQIRNKFNREGRPDHFLYLLARCVKASVRYNANGEFNQSPDNRRMGALPKTMRRHILEASRLLRGKTEFSCQDYKNVIIQASADDLIYMDPPYQGVCGNRDPRYLKSVLFDEFVDVLESLNGRDINYIVSYDGHTGEKKHGQRLPEHLKLHLVEVKTGRSTQSTLLGRNEVTVESLYLSPSLAEKVSLKSSPRCVAKQLALLEVRP